MTSAYGVIGEVATIETRKQGDKTAVGLRISTLYFEGWGANVDAALQEALTRAEEHYLEQARILTVIHRAIGALEL